jgi:hypothetical protein
VSSETETELDLEALRHRRSFTIIEWCAMRGYSRPFFYVMRKNGDAPDVIGVDKGQRITAEADARWLKRQEAKARSSEARAIAAARSARASAAKRAGGRS